MKTIVLALASALALGGAAQQYNYGDEKEYGDEATKRVCRALKGAAFPAADRPTPAQAAALKGCDPEALYFGMGVPADPVKARQCAYAIMDTDQDDAFYGARAVLMMVYANGRGAARNLDVATHLACTTEGSAPAEYQGRISHLQEIRKAGARAPADFDFCDDVTSGYAMGFCAGHDQDVRKIERAAEQARLMARWTPAEKTALATLERARDAYMEERADKEVDVTGTGRAMFIIDAEEDVLETFHKRLQALEAGRGAGGADLAAVDRELNAVYRQIQNDRDFDWGTVTKSGIRETQRAWLRYRDAWLAFARTKYPAVPQNALAAALTAERTELLKEFTD